jgi:serine/threonine-protein kinase
MGLARLCYIASRKNPMAVQERPEDAPQRLPEQVGRYEVLLPIASGGMATVYLARSRGVGGFEREVALKLTHAHLSGNRDFAVDLIEEAKLVVRIRHPNVVSVLDVGSDPNGLYLVMDYVEGDTLAALRRHAEGSGTRLPARIGLRILVDALAGLHAAHELRDDKGRPLQLVHRDFSPQNILVAADGVAQLTDFGIAKAATRLGHTTTGIVKGKIAYMSPEQARGQPLDRRSDVWAAGVIAWEILVGRGLHRSDNDVATLLKIVTDPPARVRSHDGSIPVALEEAVAEALAMDRERRCPSAAAFARNLIGACQPQGLLADVGEVSEHVMRAVGKKLAQRRRRIDEILELRAKMGRIAATSSQEQVTTTPKGTPGIADGLASSDKSSAGAASGVVLKSPAKPAAGRPGPVVEPPGDGGEADAASREEPTSLEVPRRANARPGAEVEITGTDTTSVSSAEAQVGTSTSRRPSAARIAVAGAVGAVAAAAVVAVVVGAFERAAGSTHEQTAASASTARGWPAVTLGSSAGPRASGGAGEVGLGAAGASEPRFIAISADAPVRSIAVEGRPIPVAQPWRALTVQVAAEQLARGVSIELVATDGREARVITEGGAESVSVRFPGPHGAGAVGPATGAAGGSPLAPNPYGKGAR